MIGNYESSFFYEKYKIFRNQEKKILYKKDGLVYTFKLTSIDSQDFSSAYGEGATWYIGINSTGYKPPYAPETYKFDFSNYPKGTYLVNARDRENDIVSTYITIE